MAFRKSLLVCLVAVLASHLACADILDDSEKAYAEGDFAKAHALNQQACSQKIAEGCMFMSNNYLKGEGVAQDAVKGRQYLFKACQLGWDEACAWARQLALGMPKMGLKPDPEMTKALQAIATQAADAKCQAGHASVCIDLANSTDGPKRSKYLARGMELYKAGCSNNQAEACAALGGFYRSGDMLQKDNAIALAYYKKACGMGLEYTCSQQKKVEKEIKQAACDGPCHARIQRMIDEMVSKYEYRCVDPNIPSQVSSQSQLDRVQERVEKFRDCDEDWRSSLRVELPQDVLDSMSDDDNTSLFVLKMQIIPSQKRTREALLAKIERNTDALNSDVARHNAEVGRQNAEIERRNTFVNIMNSLNSAFSAPVNTPSVPNPPPTYVTPGLR